MLVDWNEVDRSLRIAWSQWRNALWRMRDRPDDCRESPFSSWPILCSRQQREQWAARAGDSQATALAGWLRVVAVEHELWPIRIEQALEWRRTVPVPDDPQGAWTLRELRRRAIHAPRSTGQQGAAQAFAEATGRLADLAHEECTRRAEMDRSLEEGGVPVATTGVTMSHAVSVAWAALDATESLARDRGPRRWWEGLSDALGQSADRGWPARLTLRWARETLRAIDDPASHRRTVVVPEPWGALSFARALGAVGVGWLEVARDAAPSFSRYAPALGTRWARRYALLAGLVLEPCFARRALGLGAERAKQHGRAAARAVAHALRIDALRVLVMAELGRGREAAADLHHELTGRVLGASAPVGIVGVLPRSSAAAGAMLVGRVAAVATRRRLVDGFGEDWYRNPRAGAWLREADAAFEEAEPYAEGDTAGLAKPLAELLESAFA